MELTLLDSMLRLLLSLAFVASAAHAQPVRSVLEGVPINASSPRAAHLVGLEVETTRPGLEDESVVAVWVQPLSEAESASRSEVSPTQAVLLSVGATAGAIALGVMIKEDSDAATVLVLSGIVFGPSAGNFFQGEARDAAVGTGLRALGTGLVIGSAYTLFDGPGTSALGETALLATAGLGALTVLFGAGYDFVTAHKNAGGIGVRMGGAGLALEVAL